MNITLVFKNGIEWTSPDLFSKDPGWASEENGSLGGILEMRIPINKEKAIIMRNFEKYNFFVEATQDISGRGPAKIDSFYFCGSYQGKVLLYKVNPVKQTITKLFSKEGDEYAGSPTRGWREGVLGEKPKEGICSL